MPKYTRRIPGLNLHKPSGNVYVRLDGRMVYCGRHGTPEAREKYERVVAEWLARDRRPEPPGPTATVAELLAAFMGHAIGYYRSAAGEPTGEAANFADAIRPLPRLYEDRPAAEFTARELKAAREAMIAAGLARKTINARVNRIRRIWKWAAAEGLVPASAHLELQTLDALRKNRTAAREAPRILPVAEAAVRATLPKMPRAVAAMAELQLLTGCRGGEVVAIRPLEVDRSGETWDYRPGRHKTDYRDDDRTRVVHLGLRARAVLGPFLEGCLPSAPLFNPRESAARRGVRRAYDRRSYAQAIYRACDRAFPHPTLGAVRPADRTPSQKRELKEWRRRHRWSPLQLRHAAATRIRKDYGLEASQAVLGHARADVTQVYAERLDGLARDVARSSG